MRHCLKMLTLLVVICCFNVYLADSTSTTATESTSSGSAPNVFDRDHLDMFPYCGVLDTPQNVNTGRAVNAVDVRKQYRWVVLIERFVYNNIKKLTDTRRCTGSIITDRYELMG